MPHVTEAKYISGKTIWVSFDDASSGEIDLAVYLVGPILRF